MRAAHRLSVRVLALAAIVLSAAGSAWAKDAEVEPGDWKSAARLEGLAEPEIDLLAKHKVLIGVRSYPQVFSAYAATRVPVFVTSDSVIRAYNVLFEQSLGRVERARAHELPRILRSIWNGLPTAIPADADLGVADDAVAAAVRRAQIVVGTALRLLGEEIDDAPQDVRGVVEAEVRRVELAQERRHPDWLGDSSDPGDILDYDHFRPRGFYKGSPRLERYFRAAAWLQDVPFHIQRPNDLLSVAVLQNAFGRGWDRAPELLHAHRSCMAFMTRYARFLGKRGDPSIYADRGSLHLDWVKTRFQRNHPDLDDDSRWGADVVVHVLPRIQTPDGRLLGHVFEARIQALQPAPMPGGLDLVAAMGSHEAHAWRTQELGKGAYVPRAWPCAPDGEDLFSRYLTSLAQLVDEPDANAPDLFRGEAWAAKSANTVLAAWAQIRHAWALAVPDSQKFFGDTKVQPGWVEPEPEFFGRFVDLTLETTAALEAADAFDPEIGILEEVEGLKAFVDVIRRLEREGRLDGGHDAYFDALETDQERRFGGEIWTRYYSKAYKNVQEQISPEQRDAHKTEEGKKRYEGMLLREVANLVQEDLTRFEEARRADPRWSRGYGDPLRLRKRWKALALILHRLEGLAVKQLRGLPFDTEDAEFLRGYGAKLAFPMLYDGNAFAHPPADKPLVASVFSAYPPTLETGEDPRRSVLHAGTGMPCAIYVLWPHEDTEVLCRGAVTPYREVTTSARLTDDQWREQLYSKDPPQVPAWLQSITLPLRAEPK